MIHWDIVLFNENANTTTVVTPASAAANADATVLPREAMFPDEVIVHSQSGVGIYDKEEKSKYQHGTLLLSSHRIVFKGMLGGGDQTTLSPSPTNRGAGGGGGASDDFFDASIFLPLSLITSTTWSRGFGTWSHPKITVTVESLYGNSSGGGGGGATSSVSSSAPQYFYKFSFRQGGLDHFYTHLERTLKNKLWERKPTTQGGRGGAVGSSSSSFVVVNNFNTNTPQHPVPSSSSPPPSAHAQQRQQGAGAPASSSSTTTTANTANLLTSPPPTQPPTNAAANNDNRRGVGGGEERNNVDEEEDEDIAYLTRGIGLTRAVQQKERKAEEAQVLLQHQRDRALTDVDALMRNANKLVDAIARLRSQQKQIQQPQDGSSSTSGGGGGGGGGMDSSLSEAERQSIKQEVLSIEGALGIGAIVNSGTSTFTHVSATYANNSAVLSSSAGGGGGGVASTLSSLANYATGGAGSSSTAAGAGGVGGAAASSAMMVMGRPLIFQHTDPIRRTPRLYNPTTFHASLAHELLAWLTHPKNVPLSRRCVIPLVELYAYYNKARQGEAVVSATDFLEACIALTATTIRNAASITAQAQQIQYYQRQQQSNSQTTLPSSSSSSSLVFPAAILDGKLFTSDSRDGSVTEAFIKQLCQHSANQPDAAVQKAVAAAQLQMQMQPQHNQAEAEAVRRASFEALQSSCQFTKYTIAKAATQRTIMPPPIEISHRIATASHTDSQLLLALSAFSHHPSLQQLAANSTGMMMNSINTANTNSSGAAVGIGNYYELKRFRNGSVCLETPIISTRVVALLKSILAVTNATTTTAKTSNASSTVKGDVNTKNKKSNDDEDNETLDFPFLTVAQFSTLLGVHASIAEELLSTLELAGVLCRDDQITVVVGNNSGNPQQKNGAGGNSVGDRHHSDDHHAAKDISIGCNSVVDDQTLTALWTTPLFADDGRGGKGNRRRSAANARWYWNWFYPGAF